MHRRHTFSFASVSCLSAAASDSLVSPWRTGGGPGFNEALRAAAAEGVETRDDTAERAVAPRAIDGDGAWPFAELVGDDRRADAEGGRVDAVVAMNEWRRRARVMCGKL